jgi:hypothetical protein
METSQYKVTFTVYGKSRSVITFPAYAEARRVALALIAGVQEPGECLCDLAHCGMIAIIHEHAAVNVDPVDEAATAPEIVPDDEWTGGNFTVVDEVQAKPAGGNIEVYDKLMAGRFNSYEEYAQACRVAGCLCYNEATYHEFLAEFQPPVPALLPPRWYHDSHSFVYLGWHKDYDLYYQRPHGNTEAGVAVRWGEGAKSYSTPLSQMAEKGSFLSHEAMTRAFDRGLISREQIEQHLGV